MDLAAALRLPARVDLALWLATPVLSAWCSWRVLARAPGASSTALRAWLLIALAVGVAPAPSSWWAATPLLVRLTSIALQVEAARAWWRSRRVGTTVDAAAILLLCGDLVSLLGPAGLVPGPWDIASAQGGIVAAGVIALTVAGGSRSGAPKGRA